MSVDRDRVMRKVACRVLPLLFLGALLANLDKSNVGMASLQMNGDIGLSSSFYGFGVGAFFVVYAFSEVPSNLAMARFGARAWLTRIMLTWGVVSAAGALIGGPGTFLVNRILLGAAEAGYLPGAIAYLSLWLPGEYRARVLSWFMIAVPGAVVIGGPLSAALLSLDGLAGLRGWQWLFLIEGLPPIALALVMWRLLRDAPDRAEWLTGPDLQALTGTLDGGVPARHARPTLREVLRAATQPVVLLFTLVLGCLGGVNLGVTFWLPQIMKGAGLTAMQTGLASALPYATGMVGMILWSWHSDRTGDRRWHIAMPAMLAGASLSLLPLAHGFPVRFVLIVVGITCVTAMQGVFWAAVTSTLNGTQRIVGVAAINAGGTLMAFLSPYLIGVSKQLTGGFETAFLLLGLLGIAGGLLSLVLLRHMERGLQ